MSEKIMKKIIADDIHIASIVTPNLSSEGLSFLTDDENFIQVGIWNYKKGKRLETHFHNTFSREATKTNESVYVVEGKIKCNLYFENGDFISSHIGFSHYDLENLIIEKDFNVIQKSFSPFSYLGASLNSQIFFVIQKK